jgi:hypothetical protein
MTAAPLEDSSVGKMAVQSVVPKGLLMVVRKAEQKVDPLVVMTAAPLEDSSVGKMAVQWVASLVEQTVDLLVD